MDPEDKAGEMAAKNDAGFPIGFGVDAVDISSRTGCFYEDGKGFLHASGFILDPEGIIVMGVYSTGPLGRLEAETCLSSIDWYRQQRS